MKELDLHGITFMRPVKEGTAEWHYAMDYDNGDLYEAQEIYEYQGGHSVDGNHLFLIHYPDGELIEPMPSRKNLAIGEPVYFDQKISFVTVDFDADEICIYQFDCDTREVKELDKISLSSVEDCFNLRLFEHPLTLSRQPNNSTLELIWPKKKTIRIGEKESFFFREGDRLYFNTWYEDPDFREETVVRSAKTGKVIETLPGDIHIMPNGELWHLH